MCLVEVGSELGCCQGCRRQGSRRDPAPGVQGRPEPRAAAPQISTRRENQKVGYGLEAEMNSMIETVDVDLPLSDQESKALKNAAAALNKTPNDVVVDAIEKLLQDPKPDADRFELISLTSDRKTKYFIQRQHFVTIPVLPQRLKKLAEWYAKGHHVSVHVSSSAGDIMLINDTLHEKWLKKKHKKGPK